jgi:hypothetical protein
MFLKRLSILGSMLLAACVPSQRLPGPQTPANCYNNSPSTIELAAWRYAVRQNTRSAYRAFINSYPRSCFVPMATAKIANVAEKKKPPIRNVPKSPPPKKPSGPAPAY